MDRASPSAVPRGPGSYAWSIVALLWVVALLNYLDRVMIMTMRQSLTEAMPELTNEKFALLSSVFLWFCLLYTSPAR